jgi:hypothetical protein
MYIISSYLEMNSLRSFQNMLLYCKGPHIVVQILDKQEIMSEIRSDRRKAKKLQVLELHNQGFSYRKIASIVHLSLRCNSVH